MKRWHAVDNNRTTQTAKKVNIRNTASGALSALLIVCFLAALLFLKPPASTLAIGKTRDTESHTVSQLNFTSYCPSRMTLADEHGFGEAKPDEGDISASGVYNAFGPVFMSTTSSLNGDHQEQLKNYAFEDDEQVQVRTQDIDQESSIQRTQLLDSVKGAGTASSIVSWATRGDLSGVQAASCQTASLEHKFLLPATHKGWSQQLVLYNPSNKPTKVSIKAYGTQSEGALPLATRSSVVINANGENIFDVSAALPDQDGLFVMVEGSDAPVAALVRANSMSGTEAQGSDFITETDIASKQVSLAGIEERDQVSVLIMSDKESHSQLSWVTKTGTSEIRGFDAKAQKVTRINVGEAPKDVIGLSIKSDNPVYATAQLTRSSSHDSHKQSDFAMVSETASVEVSAVSLPEHTKGQAYMVNPGEDDAKYRLTGFNQQGKHVGVQRGELLHSEAKNIDFAQIGPDVSMVRLEVLSGRMTWNVRVNVPAVSQTGNEGLALLRPTSLMPRKMSVMVQQQPGFAG